MHRFPHQKLNAYQHGLAFHQQALLIKKALPRGCGELGDQLYRASSSVVLNTAEGAGAWLVGVKRRHFRSAIASLAECAAALDLISLEVEIDLQVLETAGRELGLAQRSLAGLIRRVG